MAGAGLSAGVTSTLCGEFGKSGHGIETSVEIIGQNASYHTPFPSLSHTHTHTHTHTHNITKKTLTVTFYYLKGNYKYVLFSLYCLSG